MRSEREEGAGLLISFSMARAATAAALLLLPLVVVVVAAAAAVAAEEMRYGGGERGRRLGRHCGGGGGGGGASTQVSDWVYNSTIVGVYTWKCQWRIDLSGVALPTYLVSLRHGHRNTYFLVHKYF